MHLVYLAPAIVFGLYYFVHGDISIERFRSLLSGDRAVEEIESDAPEFGAEVRHPTSKVQDPKSSVQNSSSRAAE